MPPDPCFYSHPLKTVNEIRIENSGVDLITNSQPNFILQEKVMSRKLLGSAPSDSR
jgi:hypothetical protein